MSVISIPRLPDQINVNFGPADAIADVVLATDRAARNAGIRLSLSTDFDELKRVNRANRVDWYALTPNFDPEHSALGAENAFWVKGIDHKGDVVLCHAVRLYAIHNATLADELESLRLFYDSPAQALTAGVSMRATAEVAHRMNGRMTFSGGLWVRSDYRGGGLARLIPPLSRAVALTRWYPAFHVCVVSREKLEKGMGAVYGYGSVDYSVWLLKVPGFGDALECGLCWMTTAEAEAEVEERALRLNKSVGIGLERQSGNQIHGVA